MKHFSLFLLSKIKGLSNGIVWSLLKKYGSPEEICALATKGRLDHKINQLILRYSADKNFLAKTKNEFTRLPADHISILDPDYPLLLKNIYDPPLFLFYQGNKALLASQYLLTIVGSRTSTLYHQTTTQKIIADLKGTPLVLLSGLAIGIDTIVHQEALKNGLATIAVLGSGFDDSVLYPQSNIKLAQTIVDQGGLILSEYLPNTKPALHHFPLRNRILAGLSPLSVIISGANKSGTLITAQIALDEGREVYALPGNINLRLCQGPNSLLSSGANPLLTADDILKFYKLKNNALREKILLSADEAKIINLLKIEPHKVEVLANNLRLNINLTQSLISQLEIKNLVRINLLNEVEIIQ